MRSYKTDKKFYYSENKMIIKGNIIYGFYIEKNCS